MVVSACVAAKKMPPPGWTRLEQEYRPVLDLSRAGQSIGAVHSIGLPIHVYPLYESAFRAHQGQSIQENNEESARMYAEFAKVAEQNPRSWSYGEPAATKDIIGTVSKRNRMVCFPCNVS